MSVIARECKTKPELLEQLSTNFVGGLRRPLRFRINFGTENHNSKLELSPSKVFQVKNEKKKKNHYCIIT